MPCLAELHHKDVIRLDEAGQIRAAYPFPAASTGHLVAIDAGPTVYAMCAIDALGIAAMLDRNITITSADPVTGAQIAVSIQRGQATWRPGSAVVFVGAATPAATPGGRWPTSHHRRGLRRTGGAAVLHGDELLHQPRHRRHVVRDTPRRVRRGLVEGAGAASGHRHLRPPALNPGDLHRKRCKQTP